MTSVCEEVFDPGQELPIVSLSFALHRPIMTENNAGNSLRRYQRTNFVINTVMNSHGWAEARKPRIPMNPINGNKTRGK